MKRLSFLFVMFLFPFALFSQSYEHLWKQVEEAADKDLPKTQIKLLQQIASKARSQKDYGQLLASELQRASLQTEITPDSLEGEVKRLSAAAVKAETSDAALAAVYHLILGRIYSENNGLGDDHEAIGKSYLDKVLARPEVLASHHDSEYSPLIKVNSDSRVFGNDLLHVLGMEMNRYDVLHDYYDRVGNKSAACLMALEMVRENNRMLSKRKIAKLDSLMDVYQNVPEVVDVAIARYNLMSSYNNKQTKEKYEYGERIIEKWGSWPNMNIVRNRQQELTAPSFYASFDRRRLLPGEKTEVRLSNLNNINQMRLTFKRLNLDGTTKLKVTGDQDYQTALKHVEKNQKQAPIIRNYHPSAEYEDFSDTISVPGLENGVYLVEMQPDKIGFKVQRELIYVSDLYVMTEGLPDNQIRFVVVSAQTGQPKPYAKLRLYIYQGYQKDDLEQSVTTNEKGEYIFQDKKNPSLRVYAYTDDDKALPIQSVSSRYYFNDQTDNSQIVKVFTDRSIYRPGQQVHAAAVVYRQKEGINVQTEEQQQLTFVMRDANYKLIKEVKATTDEYGTAFADFNLPQGGLTGRFSLTVRGRSSGSASIRVEEYKRPTFELTFDDYKAVYHVGDTIELTGHAKTYAGVPVQSAKVKYKVTRNYAHWWWSDDRSAVTVFEGDTITELDGSFKMRVPLVVPNPQSSAFFLFKAEADVTDQGGETHTGSNSVPLGTKATALLCDLPQKVLDEELKSMRFSYLNASGSEIEGTVKYAFDGGPMKTVKANTEVNIAKLLNSGKHQLLAVCGTDTLKQEVSVFSFNDKKPIDETHDWFYSETTTFPRDGGPVRIQIGSSDPDQYILYSVFAGNKELQYGVIRQSNALTTQKYTYREEYGTGITIVYAWVKDQKLYSHEVNIARPLPDKTLKVAWKTFRDRLTPGQNEEWTAVVTDSKGKPATSQMMATLYDKSLDQIYGHSWSLTPHLYQSQPNTAWSGINFYRFSLEQTVKKKPLRTYSPDYSKLEDSYYQTLLESYNRFLYRNYDTRMVGARGGRPLMKSASVENLRSSLSEEKTNEAPVLLNEVDAPSASDTSEEPASTTSSQMRENLNETAFFYPQLTTDGNGVVNIKFTLPESITTWRFMGLAHDKQMRCGLLTGETVAQKTVMLQPNMPRFIRQHDQAQVSARLFSTSEKAVSGKAKLVILDPATDKVLYQADQAYTIEAQNTTHVTFDVDAKNLPALIIVRMMAEGEGYSDGEQHYLAILPDQEMVMNTVPFTQHEPGVKTIDVGKLFPQNTTQQKLTIEYTNNPAWLMIQTLPYVGNANEKDAMSLVSAYYANSLGKNIMDNSPKIKQTIELWRMEKGEETSLMSSLQKNSELKVLLLSETPWVFDAEREADQKQNLMRFFDENNLSRNLNTSLEKLSKLQLSDGSWSWCPGMKGSPYITCAVLETLARLNQMIGVQTETERMMNNAFGFMHKYIQKEVEEMKKAQKKGVKNPRPSSLAVDYLYTLSLSQPKLSSQATANKNYLVDLLAKKNKEFTIYGKAVSAIILARNGYEKKAKEYLQSINEYSVFTEEMGRYFDTPKAGYSWFDYRIPTEVAAIEAIKLLTPDDKKTVEEMQRWLLQEKRTQAWDTPVSCVNAVYAFADNSRIDALTKDVENTQLKLDGKPLELPAATAGLGYVKTAIAQPNAKTFTAEKTSTVTSWGAVYAQFMQPVTDIEKNSSGITVTREYFAPGQKGQASGKVALKVGDKVKVRITIVADRDYDFVQVIDKRAACLEPVGQLSGYHWGYYCAPKDYTTTYYFDMLHKGKHVVEAEYYVDRAGLYRSGTCTAQCAYATEYSGRTSAVEMEVR